VPLNPALPTRRPGIFSRIVATGAAAGIVAGLLLTGVQHLQVTDIIRTAETYEVAAEAKPVPAHAHGHEHEHEHAGGEEHEHKHGGWQPEPGFERTAYTALADVSMAVGYALLLAAVLTLRGKGSNWRQGLLWGAAGYAVFFVAPSLGLPPELPGTQAAPVVARQAWWLCAAAGTAAALALLVWSRHWSLKVLAVVLLAAPHLVGAPQPAVHGGVAPPELARSFIVASALANAAFWLALGALTGYFHHRFHSAR
jgi:cobalt transporter subunit CbtA